MGYEMQRKRRSRIIKSNIYECTEIRQINTLRISVFRRKFLELKMTIYETNCHVSVWSALIETGCEFTTQWNTTRRFPDARLIASKDINVVSKNRYILTACF